MEAKANTKLSGTNSKNGKKNGGSEANTDITNALIFQLGNQGFLWQEAADSGEQVLVRNFEPSLTSAADTAKELNEIDWQKIKITQAKLLEVKPKAGDMMYHVELKLYMKLEKPDGSNAEKWHCTEQVSEKNTQKH